MSRFVLAAVSDLIFRSKIREVCAAHNNSIVWTTRAEQIKEALQTLQDRSALLVIDLAIKNADSEELIRESRSFSAVLEIVAYDSHLEKERMQRAGQAGATHVLARSQLIGKLSELLQSSEVRQ